MRRFMFSVAPACVCTAIAFCQSAVTTGPSPSAMRSDEVAIKQIEDDFLKAERTTDPAVLERILADDYVGVGTNGPTPGKPELVKNWQTHAGQVPPYKVEESDMHIVVRDDTAVAAYTKTYTANENGNIAHQDSTDIFARVHGAWRLTISRYTFCQK
ncbi:MAG TPA: nuclear transport factor 2 family protein [Candidatus Binatia bacterium]|nr:nuclear transport factor 2 family protein [Candidatus Binatia bacterium]